NPIVAEQILKACTLHPAAPLTMEKIAPLGAFLERSIEPTSNEHNEDGAAWQCYSLALWHHRRGDPEQTIRWGEESLRRNMATEPRVACVQLLIAMARYKMGAIQEARNLLTEAARPILNLMESSGGKWSDEITWVDWMNAHILLKEAQALIRKGNVD
nr:hypothetical protein [Akkermansiaceae bacterium]